jgi:predicted acylesterase/phospholipase RssA
METTETEENPEKEKETERMTIRHLVICGGITYGFIFFGIIHHLLKTNYLDLAALTSIHGTSAGSILAVLFAVERNQDILYNYILNRPWHDLIPITLPTILKSIKTCGLYNREPFIKILEPIFAANDLDIRKTTMLELYEHTKIDIHIYVTDLNEMKSVSINHKTHPEWRVLDAIYASCCIPVAFQPIRDVKTGHFYIDGGFLVNYPIGPCIEYAAGAAAAEGGQILGIQLDLKDGCAECLNESLDCETPSLLDYIYYIMNKLLYKITTTTTAAPPPGCEAPQEILVKTDRFCTDVMPLLKNKETRKEWIETGIQYATSFCEKKE